MLIRCPGCKIDTSDSLPSCPNCLRPLHSPVAAPASPGPASGTPWSRPGPVVVSKKRSEPAQAPPPVVATGERIALPARFELSTPSIEPEIVRPELQAPPSTSVLPVLVFAGIVMMMVAGLKAGWLIVPFVLWARYRSRSRSGSGAERVMQLLRRAGVEVQISQGDKPLDALRRIEEELRKRRSSI